MPFIRVFNRNQQTRKPRTERKPVPKFAEVRWYQRPDADAIWSAAEAAHEAQVRNRWEAQRKELHKAYRAWFLREFEVQS